MARRTYGARRGVSPLGITHGIRPRGPKPKDGGKRKVRAYCGHMMLESWAWADAGAPVTCEVCMWVMAREAEHPASSPLIE